MTKPENKSFRKFLFYRKVSSGMRALIVMAVFAIGGGTYLVASHAATVPYVGIGASSTQGYWTVGLDGGVFSNGDAVFHGSVGGSHNGSNPIVGMAVTPDRGGYWLTDRTGQVYAFGDAKKVGSLPDNYPSAHVDNIVGIAAGPNDSSYWLVGSDGGVFSFGASFYGSAGGTRLAAPIVGIASTADARGYWLVGSDGGVFTYGDAPFLGSLGGQHLSAPISGIARQAGKNAYWLVGQDGGVFSFGANFYSSLPQEYPNMRLNGPIIGIASTSDGAGYWLAGEDGGVFAFGDAQFKGTPPQTPVACPSGYSGIEPNCTKVTCSSLGQVGTYPNCYRPAPQKTTVATSGGSSGSSGTTSGAGGDVAFNGDGCGANGRHVGIDGVTHIGANVNGGYCVCNNGSSYVYAIATRVDNNSYSTACSNSSVPPPHLSPVASGPCAGLSGSSYKSCMYGAQLDRNSGSSSGASSSQSSTATYFSNLNGLINQAKNLDTQAQATQNNDKKQSGIIQQEHQVIQQIEYITGNKINSSTLTFQYNFGYAF